METRGWAVIVVGAGPAGAATAARLAARGHRTLLLDRDEFPRRKPCGECVSPAALDALTELGAGSRVLREPHAPLHGWRIGSATGPSFEGRFPPGRSGVAMARERLDAALLEHARAAGAEVRTGVKVVDLIRRGGAVTGVRATIDGREWRGDSGMVVGADGLRSVVLRRLGLLRRGPRLRKLALTARVHGLRGLDSAGELHVTAWGCVGVAEIGDGAVNVTVVVSGGAARSVRSGPAAFFDAVVAGVPSLSRAHRDGDVLATGPFDWPVRSAVADGAVLVGDAAGYYDPFTGQGIYRALRGAEIAADAVDGALRSADPSARRLAPYERARRREFGPGERLQRVIELFVSRPRLLAAAVSAIGRRPGFADALIAVTADLGPVRTLANPLHLLGSTR